MDLHRDILPSMQDKRHLRSVYKQIIRQIPAADRREQQTAVSGLVLREPCWNRCAWVFGFLPMGGEFDLSAILSSALRQGKRVALPRLHGGEMRFHEISSLELEWDIHPYGMREPGADLPLVDPRAAETEGLLVLVPGLAYDLDGYRLGYGGGFYDRLLAGLSDKAYTLGCCFREQLAQTLPREPHDRKLDGVVCAGA